MNINWFIERMKNTFQTVVLHNEVNYEEFGFYHEDLDELLIPEEHQEKLHNFYMQNKPIIPLVINNIIN